MTCECCGNEMPNNAAICPVCGTPTAVARSSAQPPTQYGQQPYSGFGEPPLYQQGYTPHPPAPPSYQQEYIQQNPGYASYYNSALTYHRQGQSNVIAGNNLASSDKKDGALIAEILLSLFGIFGVGWLMGGKTTTGIILLVCSFVFYWPIMLMGTIATLGIGLICLGPLAIGLIILNAILLNTTLERRATRVVVAQTNQVLMPPQ